MDPVDQAVATVPPVRRSRWARTALFVAPAVAFIGLLVVAVMNHTEPPKPGDPAPRFEGELLAGESSLSLADLGGKPAVLNFWASWCAPCEDEAPMLREAHEAYGDEVAIVGINIKDIRDDALEFVERHDLLYPSVWDEDRRIYDAYGLTGQPETFFIDEDGVILEHVPGPLFRETLFQMLDSMAARSG